VDPAFFHERVVGAVIK